MEHKEYADGLRMVADFLEAHPEIDLPEPSLTCYSVTSKEKAATIAKALSSGGRCEKDYSNDLVTLKRAFGCVTLHYHGMRYNVCEQVKVGTRIVPEQYVPPQPATEGHVVPEHEEAVYEWRCAPLLAAGPRAEMPEEKALTDGGTPILEAEYV